MVLFIVCHHLVYLSPDFVLRMPSFSHAEAGFMVTDEAAARLSSHSVARHRYTVLIDDVDIKEASERMRVLYSCGSEFGVKEWHRRNEIRLVAGLQVTLYEAAFFGSEGFSYSVHSGVRHNERLMVTFHASWHDNSQTHQCFSRMISQQLLLHSMACVAARQKFVKRNHILNFEFGVLNRGLLGFLVSRRKGTY